LAGKSSGVRAVLPKAPGGKPSSFRHPLLLLGFVVLLSFFFAKLEIQIEGKNGWASSLPTWKIEKHWLLDIFWGGRPMTGYHAWAFSFMFLVFHLHFFLTGTWRPLMECRVLGSLMWFWIAEDFLWFLLNPAYGWNRFAPAFVPWHKSWIWLFPTDYWTFCAVGGILLLLSFRRQS